MTDHSEPYSEQQNRNAEATIGQAFRFYREVELRSIAEQLLRCPSDYPRYGEEEAARKVQQLLQQEGIEAQLQYAAPGRPNVIARLKGAKPGRSLLFNGHLDVVPPGEGWTADPYEPVMRDGCLFARGAADMKCGVAALLYTAILFHRAGNPFAGELILLFNADEERENAGMLRFVQDGVQADGALIAEPTGLRICIGHRGVARYRLTALGQSAHAAFADHPDNAVVHMARLIPGLSALDGELRHTRHPLLDSASLSVTQISGGSAPNMIPDSCVVEIDRRLLPGETEENVRQQIVDSIERATRVYSGLIRYRLDNYLFLPASLTDERHDIVRTLREAIQETSGALPIVEAFGATCEAHFFANTLGIPTVICGPGHLEQAHTPDEYVRWSEVEDAVKCYAGLLARW